MTLTVTVGCRQENAGVPGATIHLPDAAPEIDARATKVGSDSGGTVVASPSPSMAQPRPVVEQWATWPMPNAALPGLPHPHDYQTDAAVVVDKVTGLMWQRNLTETLSTFSEAVKICEGMTVGGHDDWRLPSRIELVSILDMSRVQPSIDVTAFPHTPDDWFWSSSVAADNPQAAWYVYFYFGYPKTDEVTNRFSVRCVRTVKPRPPLPARYRVEPKQVLDFATGLRWQRMLSPQSFSFEGARSFCGHLALGGKKDWRVPTLVELLTLIDERAAAVPVGGSNTSISGAMIDNVAFPGTPADAFWTSSTFANGSDRAWYLRFDQGTGLYGQPTESFHVRCVH